MFLSYRNQSVDLLCNQLTVFYMVGTLVVKGLKWNKVYLTLIYCFQYQILWETGLRILAIYQHSPTFYDELPHRSPSLSGVFIFVFEQISRNCSNVSTVDFEQVNISKSRYNWNKLKIFQPHNPSNNKRTKIEWNLFVHIKKILGVKTPLVFALICRS